MLATLYGFFANKFLILFASVCESNNYYYYRSLSFRIVTPFE